MTIGKSLAIVVALTGLAGCSDGGAAAPIDGTSVEVPISEEVDGLFNPPDGTTVTFDDYNQLGSLLVDSVSTADITASQALITSGSASYRGVLSFITINGNSTAQLIGQANIGANFSTNTVSGSVDHFLSDTDQLYHGALRIDQGNIGRTVNVEQEFTLTSDISGTLETSGAAPITVSGQLFGDFYNDGTQILGIVVATTTVVGHTTAIESGAFIVSQ